MDETNERTTLLKNGRARSSQISGREGDQWREETPALKEENGENDGDEEITEGEVVCRVCKSALSTKGLGMQFVVKCGMCKEATPINKAPDGKKYVRCYCNCLLICSVTSDRVYCPRSNCNRLISFRPPPTYEYSGSNSSVGVGRVVCSHCKNNFLFNILSNSVARCPYCNEDSSVGPHFKLVRAFGYSGLSVLLLICAIIVVATTYWRHEVYLHLLCAAFFILAILPAYKAYYYISLKVSQPVTD